MKVDLTFFLLIAAVIVIAALLHRSCKPEVITTTQTVTTVRIDTITIEKRVYFPLPYKVVQRCIDTLYIDTGKTIRDYFTEKYYALSYQDTTLQATANILVAENAIELAQFEYRVFRPTIHTHTVVSEKKVDRFIFSLGVGANYCIPNKRAGFELLAAVYVKRQGIHLGYDFINQTPRIGWQYRIK